MQNEIAPTTTPAPAAPVLTIDTNRLRDVWLPALREEQASVEYMDKECLKARGKPRFLPLHMARMAITITRDKTVEEIVSRGGLLLIGGAQ